METKIVEATNGNNWGKFLVGRMTDEWNRRSVISGSHMPLLREIGWGPGHVWVLDLQTGEGAYFRPGGVVAADLKRHRIWVCPLFEPFLEWLYAQPDLTPSALPDSVELEAEFDFYGYRRPGPEQDAV
jgi:hypothetical protein